MVIFLLLSKLKNKTAVERIWWSSHGHSSKENPAGMDGGRTPLQPHISQFLGNH